jgi:hypothetical protein
MSQLDADAIYALASPPAYEPWPIYGAFLMAVATGQAPLERIRFRRNSQR